MLSDYLLLAGAALCFLSLPLAVVSLLATRPPRGAAIVFVLGCLVLFAAAFTGRDSIGWHSLGNAWARVTGAETAPAPQADPQPQVETAPATESQPEATETAPLN